MNLRGQSKIHKLIEYIFIRIKEGRGKGRSDKHYNLQIEYHTEFLIFIVILFMCLMNLHISLLLKFVVSLLYQFS